MDDDFVDYTDLELTKFQLPQTVKNPTEEVNEYLRNQLCVLKSENATLKEELIERDDQLLDNREQIHDLMNKMKEFAGYGNFNNTSDFVSSTQVANTKIAELSKKLREKTSEIEVHKRKCTKLETCLNAMKQKVENIEENEKEEKNEDPDLLKKLQDKLNYTAIKWAEEKNNSAKLKNDLKLANKWLQQEIGEKFDTLLTLNNNNASWRGRAQIIRDLQQKNHDLRERLKNYQEKNPIVSEPSNNSIKNENKKLDLLTRENSEIRDQYDEIKRKHDAAKARCKVLESECNLLKAKFATLNESHENDQQIIASLTSQVSCKNARRSDDLKERESAIKKLQQELQTVRIELDKQKCQIEHKSQEIVEKTDEIDLLHKKIRGSRPTSSYQNRHSENGDVKDKSVARLEVERLRLLELTELQNKRLEEERNAHLKTQNLLKVEKQKGAKLESNILRMELEQKSCSSTYSKFSSSSLNLRNTQTNIEDKLELAEENVKALSTRLEIEIYERQNDIKEFAKILRNYDYQ